MIPSTPVKTILVVDDNRALCELIEVILCTVGYHVLTAQSAADAVRLARHTPRIDLLLSDLEMPRMRGDELAARFLRLHPSAPILFVSSADGPVEAVPPFEFLAKPFTVAELRRAVIRALRMSPAFAETSNAA
jgi:CheY-like chemotaxis protein